MHLSTLMYIFKSSSRKLSSKTVNHEATILKISSAQENFLQYAEAISGLLKKDCIKVKVGNDQKEISTPKTEMGKN